MELIPIPYFGMILSLIFVPGMTFGFILFLKKIRADVEKMKYQKEIMELELRTEETHLKSLVEENKKYDKLIESKIEANIANQIKET